MRVRKKPTGEVAAFMPMMDIREQKNSLRNKYRTIRKTMSANVKSGLDADILSRILALNEYAGNEIILTYVSTAIEVDTLPFIRAALSNGKKVYTPRCIVETRDVEYYRVTSLDELEKGAFGLMEPNPEKAEKLTDFSKGLCIVPGLSFDASGYRLGYGMGYYDRFLSEFGGASAGICYGNCVQWKLPQGHFDRAIDILVTEKYIRRIRKAKSPPR